MDPGSRHPIAASAGHGRRATALLAAALLAGCAATAAQPVRTTQVAAPPPPPEEQAQVFVYPAGGQDERQLDRDRYECHRWAVRQSEFDPSLPGIPPHQRLRVVRAGPPPGSGVAAGAVTGAAIGAAVSNPWDRGEGALVGAAAGAVIGAIAEDSQSRRMDAVQDQADEAAVAEQERRASDYRRAITACLEGRGYSVR